MLRSVCVVFLCIVIMSGRFGCSFASARPAIILYFYDGEYCFSVEFVTRFIWPVNYTYISCAHAVLSLF